MSERVTHLQEVDICQLTIACELAGWHWAFKSEVSLSCSTVSICSATAQLYLKLPARPLCVVDLICTSLYSFTLKFVILENLSESFYTELKAVVSSYY